MNRQAQPEMIGKTGNQGTRKPPWLPMSLRLRNGMIPNETSVNASNVPILTRSVSRSRETSPPMTAIIAATIQSEIFGVLVLASSLFKNDGKRPSRLIE